MRIELPDGSWAELRERPTLGQMNIVRRALLRTSEELEAAADVAVAYVQAYVSAWSVKNAEGTDIPLEQPENAPDDVVQAIAKKGKELYAGRPDPKGSATKSATSPEVMP